MPESPIRHSGWPLRTQSQVARVWMVAGLMLGLASKSKSAQPLLAGEPGGLDPAVGAAAVAVVAFGHQQFGEEPAVGQLFAGGGVGELGELGADGGQPQHPAGLVDRGVGGLLGQSAVAFERRHDASPSAGGSVRPPAVAAAGRRRRPTAAAGCRAAGAASRRSVSERHRSRPVPAAGCGRRWRGGVVGLGGLAGLDRDHVRGQRADRAARR